jgi:hypothetical protein
MELVTSSLAIIVGFTLLGVYCIIPPPLTLAEVLMILAFSAVFTLGVDVPKYYVFQKL